MSIELGVSTPQELVVLLVALGGVIPILYYRRQVTGWIALPYVFLLLGAGLTNLEHLVWYDLLNYLEHSIANLGAGLSMAVAAYLGRDWLRRPEDSGVE